MYSSGGPHADSKVTSSRPPSVDIPISDNSHSAEAKFQFSWPVLEHTDEHIKDDGWQRRSIPAVVYEVPDDIVTSEFLQAVLRWSLQKSSEIHTGKDTVQETPLTSHAITDGDTVRDAPIETLPEVADSVALGDRSDASTISSTNSRRMRPLVSRLKQLRKDMTHTRSLRTKRNLRRDDSENSCSPLSPPTTGECISCFDEFSTMDLTALECSHNYCRNCLREVVLTAMKTESAFPPKCCLTEIPLRMALSCLDTKQRAVYKDKSAEYSIPAGHRWYCPEPKCAKWIRPEKLHRERQSQQTCPHCKVKICSHCRSIAHDGEQDCPEDFGLNSTLEVAEAEGWRRCYSCRTMVELTTGCRHITCKCGAQFCYVCNAKWRTCNCTESDKERRLQRLRDQRVQRQRTEVEDSQRQAEEDAAALLEAEEVAEAIRQIEEMERENAIRQVEEERQRQLEEELLLAELEEARLLEEIARREAEEEAERELQRILLDSSKEQCQALMKTLMQLLNHQHVTMTCDHIARKADCLQQRHQAEHEAQQEANKLWTWLHDNIEQRKVRLTSRHNEEFQRLSRQFEEEEDDLFIQMTMYLRDKPNRDQREKKMRDTLQSQQNRERDAVLGAHQQAFTKLQHETSYELEGLAMAAKTRLQSIEEQHQTCLRELGLCLGSERRWFQLVSTRRIEMLKAHRALVTEQLEAGQEPLGLVFERAITIEPFIPELEDTEGTADSFAIVEEMNIAPVITGDVREDADLYGAATSLATTQSASRSGPDVLESSLTRSNTPKVMADAYRASTTLQSSATQSASRKHKYTDSAISMSGVLAMSFMVHSTDSMEPNSTSQDHVRETSRTSSSMNSADADLLDSISASKVSAGSRADPVKKSFFRKFRKGKDMSEDEIRRRMSSCVGDGMGR